MKNKKDKIIIIIAWLIIGIELFSNFTSGLECEATMQIAKAIVVLEKDEILKTEFQEHSTPMEYHFCLNNYQDDEINEVEFDCILELQNSTNDFPISYQLWDCDQKREISFIDGKSESITIKKGQKESRKFKLILKWCEREGVLADNLQIKLRVDVVQNQKGEIDENKKSYHNNIA